VPKNGVLGNVGLEVAENVTFRALRKAFPELLSLCCKSWC
jgi:hypothetical protein